MDELIRLVAQRAGISEVQAALAVSTMLGYLATRLPSPVVGRIREQLGEVRASCPPGAADRGTR